MKVFELPARATPRERGRAHGEAFAPMIAEIAEIRLDLTVRLGGFADRAEVLSLAAAHEPVLAEFDRGLAEELSGIAEGSRVDLARIVVLNHYTDLRDIPPASKRGASSPTRETEDDCSAVFARTPEGALLGQTWDMHGSAEPYVAMLRVPEDEGTPAAWVFSMTGCVGMTGLNSAGVGITINNLNSVDARIGVVWPALVRRALRERTAEGARDVILGARLGSGHHYLVASDAGVFGIESSGTRCEVVYGGDEPAYVHTNHCIDPAMAKLNTIGVESTTRERYAHLTESVAARPVRDRRDLFDRLGSHDGYPASVCSHLSTLEKPHAMKTCGALVMDLRARDLWAVAGCANSARPHTFGFAG